MSGLMLTLKVLLNFQSRVLSKTKKTVKVTLSRRHFWNIYFCRKLHSALSMKHERNFAKTLTVVTVRKQTFRKFNKGLVISVTRCWNKNWPKTWQKSYPSSFCFKNCQNSLGYFCKNLIHQDRHTFRLLLQEIWSSRDL